MEKFLKITLGSIPVKRCTQNASLANYSHYKVLILEKLLVPKS